MCADFVSYNITEFIHFLWHIFGRAQDFLYVMSCYLQIEKSITFFFRIWIPLIYFSFLIAMARTFNNIVTESVKSGYLCLVLNLIGKAFSLSWLWYYLWKWQPTPVLLPEKFHRWKSLLGYSPWGRKESDYWAISLSHLLYIVFSMLRYIPLYLLCWEILS